MKFIYAPLLLIIATITAHLAVGQHYHFKPAEKLPQNINSQSEESYPLLAPDGKALYFTRFDPYSEGGRLEGSDIWMSSLSEKGEWQKVMLLPKSLNNKKHNVAIGFNESGKYLYLLNSYFSTQKSDIVKVDLESDDLKPVLVDVPKINTTDGFLGLYVHPSERIILVSMAGQDSFGQEDLYVVQKDTTGEWLKPQNLGPMINTNGFEISPYLSKDGKTLFFSSNGHRGFGDADIFMAHRLYDTWNVWTRPVNLGNNINSAGFDAYFTLNNSDKAYFVSNKNGKLSDIYTSDVILSNVDSTQVKIQQLIEDAQKLLEKNGEVNK